MIADRVTWVKTYSKTFEFCHGTAILGDCIWGWLIVRSATAQRVSTHLMWQPLTGDVRGETRLASPPRGRVLVIVSPSRRTKRRGRRPELTPSEKDYESWSRFGANSVVGCGEFGATVSLPKIPKPIVRSRTIRQAAKNA